MSISKKIWNFLWKGDSIWSWIVDIILIFLIVKFIIFPFFSLVFGTSLPFVIIESTSMQHEGSFNSWFSLHGQWYLDNNISKNDIREWPWYEGLDKGDVIIVKSKDDYKKGDVIIFKVKKQKVPIIHRIIDKRNSSLGYIFSTKGDHNDGQLSYEHHIEKNQIIGKAVGRIPKIGWLKLFFVNIFK